MALSVAAAAPPALASGSSVTKSGRCGIHPWSLVLAHDNGRIEADYKLGNVKVGSTWRVVMKDNGVRFFRFTACPQSCQVPPGVESHRAELFTTCRFWGLGLAGSTVGAADVCERDRLKR
jgi:hypothetical protein